MQHGHGDYAYGEREHEGVGDKLSGHGIRCAEHRQDAEHDEDIQVAEGVVFKEGVEYCQQDSDASYNQQPGAAQKRDPEACGYSDGEEYYAEDQVFTGLELVEYQVRHREGVLVVNPAAEIGPVAEQVACGMQDHDPDEGQDECDYRGGSCWNLPRAE